MTHESQQQQHEDNLKKQGKIFIGLNINTIATLLSVAGICWTASEMKGTHDTQIKQGDAIEDIQKTISKHTTKLEQIWEILHPLSSYRDP